MNCRKLSELELQLVEQMGSTGFTPGEIALVLQVEAEALINEFKDQTSLVYTRYQKGYLQAQLKLRLRIAKDAEAGSSPAQTLMKKIFDECEYQIKQL